MEPKDMGEAGKSDLVRTCGYVSTQFEIKRGRKQIRLVPVSWADEEE